MPLHTPSTLLPLFDQSTSVCTDTRKLTRGCIFFALKGPNFNGNIYAAQALEQGARFVVVDEETHFDATDPRYLLVADGLEALQGLATLHRRRFDIPIFGLTGSNGKTTTKEILYAVMQQEKKVHATHGNFNNHIGVPLTLLAMPKDTEFAIIEMGANQPGDIAELAKIAEPTHGLITNVGAAHLEKLGNLAGVQRTKGALFDFVKAQAGVIFVNTADPRVVAAAGQAQHQVTYGSPKSTYWGEILDNQLAGMSLRLHHENGSVEAQSPLSGAHNAKNIVAAWAVGHHFGLSSAAIQKGISHYRAENNRSQVLHQGPFTIWLDAYNANPSSMRAAI
ncbi:MAG: UDP-N-acetylmuramoyl-tripeptide--D-alanyl-D-alanine ligase, partial [Bacteroidota bacterium]